MKAKQRLIQKNLEEMKLKKIEKSKEEQEKE
jgi:hypothetical protein